MRSIIEGIASGAITKEEGLRQIAALKQQHTQDLLYFTRNLTEQPLTEGGVNRLGHVLVLAADSLLRPLLQNVFASAASSFTLVTAEELGGGDGIGLPSTRIGDEHAYVRLLEALEQKGQFPGSILHLLSQEEVSGSKLEEGMESGIYSVFALTKAVLSFKKRSKTSLLFHYKEGPNSSVHAALEAFAKSAMIENPGLLFKAVSTDHGRADFNALSVQPLLQELSHMQDGFRAVHYRNSRRLVPQLLRHEAPSAATAPPSAATDRPAYLITGGLGALGYMLAGHLAESRQADLILTGRSQLSEAGERKLDVLRRAGSRVMYMACDTASQADLEQLLTAAKARFSRMYGILHCAGVTEDAFILRKTRESMAKVLAPKVAGTVNLYHTFRNEPLDSMILFSSISAVIGNMGQSDYAYANSFMDYFAVENRGSAPFKLISVNWPLWEEGGMATTADSLEILRKNLGILPLPTGQGLNALDGIGRGLNENTLVLYGDAVTIEEAINKMNTPAQPGGQENAKPAAEEPAPQMDISVLKEGAEQFLKQIFIKVTKIPPHALGLDDSFEKIGFDSIMAMSMNEELEAVFGELSKTLLFEHQTLRELGEYFAEHHAATLGKVIKPQATGKAAASGSGNRQAQQPQFPQPGKPQLHRKGMPAAGPSPKPANPERLPSTQDIAIVGISGKFPMSPDLQTFWDNLLSAQDCITEIPADRWSIDEFYTTDKNELGKMYCKWGGFLEDVDRFDALFFNISPREAEIMDPQERLFLECAYSAIEDAGYTRDTLGSRRVGVFAGVMYGQYQLLDAEVDGRKIALSSVYASIANRVSYHLNLNGPSIALDTMCSSSLTSIHLACDSIRRGESDFAIAGGVNVSIHPDKYIFLSQQKFAASDGRCHSFGEGGDGYVPGEGVGAVLLKPVDRAVSDGDHIYAVIKGSSINHGGKTTGYTVPNPAMQGAVIQETLQAAGVHPRTINYIEAHGTGTSLGDPIEVSGLVKAFKDGTGDKQFCAIGSVKSNIGHCESAAGIAAIAKVLLQMKYGVLVPSLHSEELNGHINFGETPFYVQRQASAWNRVSLEEASGRKEYPRRAGVSSFGAGGANAHIILEEYIPVQDHQPVHADAGESGEQVIVLSARSEERLKAYAGKLGRYAASLAEKEVSLADIAYTLQVGREYFSERLALIAGSVTEMQELLGAYCEGQMDSGRLYRGNAKGFKEYAELLSGIQPGVSLPDLLLESGNTAKIAQLWTLGLEVDFRKLHADVKRKRVPLPTYPFARNRYWVNEVKRREISFQALIHEVPGAGQLVERNLSTIGGFRFNSRAEIINRHYGVHTIQGQAHLNPPGILAFAREALELAGYDKEQTLADIVWSGPVMQRDGLMLDAYLYPEGEGALCEIRDGAEKVLFQCRLAAGTHILSELPEAEAFLSGAEMPKDELSIGERQTLQTLYGIPAALAGVRIGRPDVNTWLALVDCGGGLAGSLDPQVLGAAGELLLAAAALTGQNRPVSLQSAAQWAYRRISAKQWLIMLSSGSNGQYTLTAATPEGELAWRLEAAFTARLQTSEPENAMLYYTPQWIPSRTGTATAAGSLSGDTVLFLADAAALPRFRRSFGAGTRLIFVTPAEHFAQSGDNQYGLNFADKEQLAGLLHSLTARGVSLQQMVYLADAPDLAAEAKLNNSLYPLLFLVQALMESKAAGKVRLVYAFTDHGNEAALLDKALGGFIKTLRLESPAYSFKTVSLDPSLKAEEVPGLLEQELNHFQGEQEVSYSGEGRFVKRLVPAINAAGKPPQFTTIKENGVYIITGGLGGLGRLFAAYLAKTAGARLILTGRSPLDEAKKVQLAEIAAYGGTAEYIVSDAAKMQDAEALVRLAKDRYGRINGILHCAGLHRDAYILKKDTADFEQVISSKVISTLNLDHAFKDEQLELMLLFSSLTGETGNPGQADYAYANQFLNEFALYRGHLAAKGERTGRTVSVAWPLWEADGMQLPEEQRRILELQTGLVPLPADKGISAFEYALQPEAANPLIVGYGKPARLHSLLEGVNRSGAAGPDLAHTEKEARGNEPLSGKPGDLLEQTVLYLTGMFSELLKLETEEIDVHTEFEEYGIESVMIGYFNSKLEEDLGEVSKTLLFEYQTIASLAAHLEKQYGKALAKLLIPEPPALQEPAAVPADGLLQGIDNRMNTHQLPGWQELSSFAGRYSGEGRAANPAADERIAIIGLSGKYPHAGDIDEFWDNIAGGRDCTEEIPASRWDYRKYLGGSFDKVQEGKMYSKWGGFVEDVDKFDPAFFNIAPREAVIMDPQERMFAETVWSAIEDAGYTKSKLQRYQEGHGANIGVFAGATTYSYQLWGPEEWERGNLSAMPNVSPWSIANRISYMFNFSGPSLAIDTACSSSLAAIHAACESLKNKECRLAVAGGVNLYLHPYKYVLMCQTRMLSPTGKCHSFGDAADGFVPGEGVGAVLLKPLSEAIRDNDHIYGVIRATEINHGGKVSGYTVPNPVAQVNLISKALKKADVDASTISYMEAHGTGTKLGDPIEINALNQVFGEYQSARQSCSIGSVKSNIGHLEAAAGIASVTKVLLQLKHKQLAPSIHAEKANSNIDFGNSHFRVQQQAAPWIPSGGGSVPRRAGVSSFGAGGTNAFVLIEEYEAPGKGAEPVQSTSGNGHIIVLSAKTPYSLKQAAIKLRSFMQRYPDTGLGDLAFTLQTGREEMACRLAFTAASITETLEKLSDYISGGERTDIYTGTVSKRDRPGAAEAHNDESTAEMWGLGAGIDWPSLHSQGQARIIPLPTYAFERESYWITRTESGEKPRRSDSSMHPLVDRNISSFSRQQYETLLDGGHSSRTFGYASFIELFRAASELSLETPCRVIEDVAWGTLPPQAGESRLVTSLYEEGRHIECETGFEDESGNYVICAQGKVSSAVHRQPGPGVPGLDSFSGLRPVEQLPCVPAVAAGCIESLREVRTGDGRAMMGVGFKQAFAGSESGLLFNDLAAEALVQSLVSISLGAEVMEYRTMSRCIVHGALAAEVRVLALWRLLQENTAVYEITVVDAKDNVILTMEELVLKLTAMHTKGTGVLETSAPV